MTMKLFLVHIRHGLEQNKHYYLVRTAGRHTAAALAQGHAPQPDHIEDSTWVFVAPLREEDIGSMDLRPEDGTVVCLDELDYNEIAARLLSRKDGENGN